MPHHPTKVHMDETGVHDFYSDVGHATPSHHDNETGKTDQNEQKRQASSSASQTTNNTSQREPASISQSKSPPKPRNPGDLNSISVWGTIFSLLELRADISQTTRNQVRLSEAREKIQSSISDGEVKEFTVFVKHGEFYSIEEKGHCPLDGEAHPADPATDLLPARIFVSKGINLQTNLSLEETLKSAKMFYEQIPKDQRTMSWAEFEKSVRQGK